MKSFWLLIQRVLLALLVGAVPVTLTACGDDDAPPGQAITLLSLTIDPTSDDVEIGGESTFTITEVTVKLDPNAEDSTPVGVSEEDLAAALEDGTIDQAEHDAIVAAVAAIQWSSEDEDIATVSGTEISATATGVAAGTTDITATVPMEIADPEGYEAAVAAAEEAGEDEEPVLVPVTVSAALTVLSGIDSIALSTDEATINVGGTVDLDAEVIDGEGQSSDLDDEDVTYTSSDEDIATVDDNGVVTGVDLGTVTITAEYEGFSAEAEITVAPLEFVLVNGETGGDSATITAGETLALTVNSVDADGDEVDVTSDATGWASSNEDVATVDADGVVTGVGAGTATITAEINGETVEITVTVVVDDPEGLQITPTSPELAVGESTQLEATAVYAGGVDNDVTDEAMWETSDDQVVVVDETGMITGVAYGEAEVTASFDGASATVTVSVTAGVALAVVPQALTLPAGAASDLTATVTLEDGTSNDVTDDATWSSSNDTVASVSADGTVTAESAGEATITAAFGGMTDTAMITVTATEIERVVVTPNPVVTPVGIDVQLMAEAQYTDGSNVDVTDTADWSSDDASVSVDGGMLVGSMADVSTMVTASFDGVEGTASVTITDAVVVSLSAAPASVTLAAQTSTNVAITATLSDDTTTMVTSSAAYSTDDETIASAAGGVITGNGEGLATITVTLGDASVEIPVTVTPADVVSIALSPNPVANLPIGGSRQMTATATFSDATTQDITSDPNVTWSTADAAIATVDASGSVTGVAEGQTTVTVTYANGTVSVSESAAVLVIDATVETIALIPDTATIKTGFTQAFTATGTYTDGSIADITEGSSWSTGDTAIATVAVQNGSAIVYGVSAGTTTVSVTRDGVTQTADITVENGVLTSISIQPAVVDVARGDTQQFVATGVFQDGSTANVTREATWGVVDPTECGGGESPCVPTATEYVSVSNEAGFEGLATANEITVDQSPEDATNPDVFRSTITASLQNVSATARMGVVSDEIEDITIAVVDDAGTNVTVLPLGETVSIIATCTYVDGRRDPDCADMLNFTSSTAAVTVDSTANTATGAAPGGSAIAPVAPASALATVTMNTVVITVLECDFTTLTIVLSEFPQEGSNAILPLGGSAQALAVLDDGEGGLCNEIALSSGVAWTPNNSSVTASADGTMTASATPNPPVSAWQPYPTGSDPVGLPITLSAIYTDADGNELNDTQTFTLRDACVDTFTATPAIGARHPIPPAGESRLEQDTHVMGSFSIPGLAAVDLTEAESGLDHSIVGGVDGVEDAFTGAEIGSESGIIGVPSDANEGTFTVRVARGGQDFVDLGDSTIPLCSTVTESEFTVTTVDTPVTGVTVSAPGDRTVIGSGETPAFTAELNFADDSIPLWDVTSQAEWSSSNTSVIAMGDDADPDLPPNQGEADSDGTAIITAVYANQTGALSMEVSGATLESIEVSMADVCTLDVGTALPDGLVFELIATGTYSDGSERDITDLATFSVTSGTDVVSVAGSTATTLAEGSAVISASAPGVGGSIVSGAGETLDLDVEDYDVNGIVIRTDSGDTSDPYDIPAGSTQQFEAVISYDAVGASTTFIGSCVASGSVTWGITPAATATVDATGLVTIADTASDGDTADLTATIGSVVATRNIDVTESCVTSIAINQDVVSLLEGDTSGALITASITLANGQSLSVPGADVLYAVTADGVEFGAPGADEAGEYSTPATLDCPEAVLGVLDESYTWYCFETVNTPNAQIYGTAGAGSDIQMRAFYVQDVDDQPVDVCPDLGTAFAASSAANPTEIDVNQTVTQLILDCDPSDDFTQYESAPVVNADYPNFGNPSFYEFDSVSGEDLIPGVYGYCSVWAVYSSGGNSTVATAANVTAQVVPGNFTATGGQAMVHANESFVIETSTYEFAPISVAATSTADQTLQVAFQGATSNVVTFGATSPNSALDLDITDTRVLGAPVPVSDAVQQLPLFSGASLDRQYFAHATVADFGSTPRYYDLTSLVTWSSDNTSKVTAAAGGVVTPVSCDAPAQATITATDSAVSPAVSDTINVQAACAVCTSVIIDLRNGDTLGDPGATQNIGVGEQVQFGATCTLDIGGDTVEVTESAAWNVSGSGVSNLGGGLVEGVTVAASVSLTATVDDSTTDDIDLLVVANCVEEVRIVELLQGVIDGDNVPSEVPVEFVLEGRLSGNTEFTESVAHFSGVVDASFDTTIDGGDFPGTFPGRSDCVGLDRSGAVSYTTSSGTVNGLTVTSSEAGVLPQGTDRQYQALASFDEFTGTYDVGPEASWTVGDGSIISVDGNGLVTGVSEGSTTVNAAWELQSGFAVVSVGGGILDGLVLQIFEADFDGEADCAAYFSNAVGDAETGETNGYIGDIGSGDSTSPDTTLPLGGYTSRVRVLGTYSDGSVSYLSTGFTFTVTDDNGQSTGTTVAADGTITTGTAASSVEPVVIYASGGGFTSNVIMVDIVDGLLTGITARASDGSSSGQTLLPGQSAQLLASGQFYSGEYCITPDATFSATPGILTVNADGTIVANSAGSKSVTASIGGGAFTDPVDITVDPDSPVSSVTMSIDTSGGAHAVSTTGGTVQIDAVATLASGATVDVTTDLNRITWLVDDNGLIAGDPCDGDSCNPGSVPSGVSINNAGLLTIPAGIDPGETFTVVALVQPSVRDSSVVDNAATTDVDESIIRGTVDIITVSP